MRKQYHYILAVEDSGEVSIDWDTTQVMLEEQDGAIFDPDTQEWESAFKNPKYEAIAEKLSRLLSYLQISVSPSEIEKFAEVMGE
jgi:hypothetical protein